MQPRLGRKSEVNFHLLRMLFSEAKKGARGPAIFLDRDGVINQRRPDDYVLDWSQFVFMPGARTALKKLATLKLPMIVISNQAAVGKGLLNPVRLEEITSKMYQSLAADETLLAAAYYCPHRPDENCVCRKPKPELLFRAAEDFNLDLSRSIFIGDSDTDIRAARAAGCVPVLLGADVDPQPTPSMDFLIAREVTDIYTVVVNCLQAAERA